MLGSRQLHNKMSTLRILVGIASLVGFSTLWSYIFWKLFWWYQTLNTNWQIIGAILIAVAAILLGQLIKGISYITSKIAGNGEVAVLVIFPGALMALDLLAAESLKLGDGSYSAIASTLLWSFVTAIFIRGYFSGSLLYKQIERHKASQSASDIGKAIEESKRPPENGATFR